MGFISFDKVTSVNSRALLLGLLLLAGLMTSNGTFAFVEEEQEFLPPEQAFQVQHHWVGNVVYLAWTIADNYYLYQDRSKLFLLNPEPGEIKQFDLSFVEQGIVKNDPNFGEMQVFYQSMQASADIPNTYADLNLELHFQGCAESGLCYRIMKEVITVPKLSGKGFVNASADEPLTNTSLETKPTVEKKTGAVKKESKENLSLNDVIQQGSNANLISEYLSGQSFVAIVTLFFLLGFGLAFTPCIFPMIPIVSGIVVGQSEKLTPMKGLALSFTYVTGTCVTYGLIGFLAASLGAKANLQIYFQHPAAVILVALLFVILSLAMFGFYELQLPEPLRSRLNKSGDNKGGGHANSFVLGVMSALVVSPCVSAPLAGALIYISLTGDIWLGVSALVAMGYGIGMPLLLIGVTGGSVLPKSGQWMERIKAFFGIGMLAVAIWLIARLSSDNIDLAIWGVFALGLSIYLGALEKAESNSAKLLRLVAIVIGLYGATLVVGSLMGNSSFTQPLKPSGTSTEVKKSAPFVKISQLTELNALLAGAKTKGQPVLIDVYADWCTACITLDNEVFSKTEAQAALDDHLWIKFDITENREEHFTFMEELNLFGPPAILFYNAEGVELSDQRILGEIKLQDFLVLAEKL